MAARCGKALSVHCDSKGVWTLGTKCPNGHLPGTKVEDLINKLCPACPFIVQNRKVVVEVRSSSKTDEKTGDVAPVGAAPAEAVPPEAPPMQAPAAPLPAVGDVEAPPPAAAPSDPAGSPPVSSPPAEEATEPPPQPLPEPMPPMPEASVEPMPIEHPTPGYVGSAFIADGTETRVLNTHHRPEDGAVFFLCQAPDGVMQWMMPTQLQLPTQPKSTEPEPPHLMTENATGITVNNVEVLSEPVLAEPVPASAAQPMAATEVHKKDYNEKKLPSLTDITLPGEVQLASDEARVDVDAVLEGIEGCPGGPSKGGFAHHHIRDFATCEFKAYCAYVLGLRPILTSPALSLGSVYHACKAMRYLHGAEYTYVPCDKVTQAGAPGIAEQVRKMIRVEFELFEQEEWQTWCPRAVEQILHAWLPPTRVGRKQVRIPLACRTDLLVAFKQPNESHPPPGPVSSGIHICDHKTTSFLTQDLTVGYGMDSQLKYYVGVYTIGGHEATYGPYRGVQLCIAAKHKDPGPKSFFRPRAPYNMKEVTRFMGDVVTPLATRFYEMLTTPEIAGDETKWRKNDFACQGRFGLCPYFHICDNGHTGDRVNYKVDEGSILRVEDFVEYKAPSARKKKEQAAAAPVDLDKEAKKAEKKAHQATVVEGLASTLLERSEEDPAYAVLNKQNFLVPNHTRDGVVKALADALAAFYAQYVEAKTKIERQYGESMYSLAFRKTGFGWNLKDTKVRGVATWKQVATRMADSEWFNVKHAMPDTML